MRTVFIDTSAVVALFDGDDRQHRKARALLETIRQKKVTLLMSDYVLDESITTAMSRVGHGAAVKAGEFILNSKVVNLVWLDEPTVRKAWDYFRRHSDKGFSFTDCTSFVLMRKMDVNHYFAFDRHFEKAGFTSFS